MAGIPTVKITLAGTKVENFSTGTRASLRYYVDLARAGVLSPAAITQAIKLVPQIGDYIKDFGTIPGPPIKMADGAAKRWFNTLRCSGHMTGSIPTGSGQKHYIDVICESRPLPSIEVGSIASQKRTSTFLDGRVGAKGARRQMVLDWIARQGIYSDGTSGQSIVPPSDLVYLKTPVSGTRFDFGCTVRLSSSWYYDEFNTDDLQSLELSYATGINQDKLFFSDFFDDRRLWMCTSISSVSHDGGFIVRLTGEFAYSPIGWDTIATYTIPNSNESALVSDDVMQRLYAGITDSGPNSSGGNRSIPNPDVVPGEGAGRFPQQFGIKMQNLVGFLSQGILFPSPKNVSALF